ncbi:MAG: 4-alpha-glucanotransferase [Clostridiales bacterium]|nr:4-alpha-glucanotransferase [Clostridiales bacterium]
MKSSGILLHITSLPCASGVGSLAEVDRFIEFLRESKQKYWQILPITPTDFVNSPYASPSAFAGNTLLIDADELERCGLVSDETLAQSKNARGNDYGYAIYHKELILREAYANFIRDIPPRDFVDFCDKNSYWLNDYALFCALKKHFEGKSWLEWSDEKARMRNEDALKAYSVQLADEIEFVQFCQYLFDKQWKNFRQKLKDADVKLIGDIPIYVAYDSADVWAHPELFELTKERRRPRLVAGVPPDYFSADGQLWGNPLYKWSAMKKDNYDWWTKRVGRCAELFDVLRIDHFRAFDSYYAIKYGATTARVGTWKKGVGYNFLKHIQDSFPSLTIVAEDLGDIPKSVLELRDKCGLAGMKVMQFGYDGNPSNAFLPQNFEEHCVAYLGTHDNDTTVGWWNSLNDWQRGTVRGMSGVDGEHISLELIEKLAFSRAELVVYSMQDLAEEDTNSRMNVPGTLGCWKYMAKRGDFSQANAKWLAELTVKSHRA